MKLQNLSRQQQGDRSIRRFAPSMRWVEADAMALPLGDGEIDAATMGYGLRNVANIPQVMLPLRSSVQRYAYVHALRCVALSLESLQTDACVIASPRICLFLLPDVHPPPSPRGRWGRACLYCHGTFDCGNFLVRSLGTHANSIIADCQYDFLSLMGLSGGTRILPICPPGKRAMFMFWSPFPCSALVVLMFHHNVCFATRTLKA